MPCMLLTPVQSSSSPHRIHFLDFADLLYCLVSPCFLFNHLTNPKLKLLFARRRRLCYIYLISILNVLSKIVTTNLDDACLSSSDFSLMVQLLIFLFKIRNDLLYACMLCVMCVNNLLNNCFIALLSLKIILADGC